MAGSKECMGVSLWLELNDKLFTKVSQALNTVGNCFRISLSISSCVVVSMRGSVQ